MTVVLVRGKFEPAHTTIASSEGQIFIMTDPNAEGNPIPKENTVPIMKIVRVKKKKQIVIEQNVSYFFALICGL